MARVVLDDWHLDKNRIGPSMGDRLEAPYVMNATATADRFWAPSHRTVFALLLVMIFSLVPVSQAEAGPFGAIFGGIGRVGAGIARGVGRVGAGIFRGVGRVGAGIFRGVGRVGAGIVRGVGRVGAGVLRAGAAVGRGALRLGAGALRVVAAPFRAAAGAGVISGDGGE